MNTSFSMNGSPGFNFGEKIDLLDLYKKQQLATLNNSLKLNINGLVNTGVNGSYEKLTDRFKDPTTPELKSKIKTEAKQTVSGLKNLTKGNLLDTKFGKFGGQYGGAIGNAASMIGDIIGKRGLDGKYGSITKGVDTAIDTVQKAASAFGPVGSMVSMGLGAAKLLGNTVSKLGGGTDGMTKTDAILNSTLLNLTPLGLINGFGGKRAKTYTRNNELDSQTNGAFLGFLSTQDLTQIGAGKKYGLFSSGARHKQDELNEFTLNMKRTVSGIVDTNTINNLAALGSTPFLAQQLSIDLSGGIQQMRAARQGMQFSRRVVSKYQTGKKLKRSIQTVDIVTGKYVDLPTDLTSEQIKGQAPIKLANGMVVFLLKNGMVDSGRWETIGEREHLTPKGEDGLQIEEFKNGGQMNVIPEGALHARLHHLGDINEDLKDLTPKGIPVITVEEGGEIVQHAEIEHSEIIFTKEVTDKVEELRKQYHLTKDDKYTLEAGKFLVQEILYNTDDRTNLIKSIE